MTYKTNGKELLHVEANGDESTVTHIADCGDTEKAHFLAAAANTTSGMFERDEHTSSEIASLAAKMLNVSYIEVADNPDKYVEVIRKLAGSALTQAPNKVIGEVGKAELIETVVNQLCLDIHADNVKAGWWKFINGVKQPRNVGELLMLMVSELAEAMEGERKNLMDDKLPHRPMVEVELADCSIRIMDFAGSRNYDLGGAIAEKRAFNATRADHKLENRNKPGGKSF